MLCPQMYQHLANNSVNPASNTPTTCNRAPAGFVSGPRTFNKVRIPSSCLGTSAMFHGAVIERGKEKPDADLVHTIRYALGREIDLDTQRRQDIGAAALGGHRPIAVLRDRQPGPRHDKRRRGRNVKRMGAVAAGPACIHYLGVAHPDLGRASTHGLHGAGNFFHRFALHAQAHEVGRNLRGTRRAVHDFTHDGVGFQFGEIGPIGQFLKRVFDHSENRWLAVAGRWRRYNFRKFRSSSLPAVVRIDSGWNCTPSIPRRLVPHPHNLPLGRFGADLKTIRQRLAVHDERMVAGGLKGIGQIAKNRAAVMPNHGRFAMHQTFGPDHFTAKCDGEGLVAETDPQQRAIFRRNNGSPPRRFRPPSAYRAREK